MTRRGRRRQDRVTVDELLRQAGVRSRKPGSRAADRPGPEPPHGAAGRIALASAALVVLGGLVFALVARTDPIPGSTQFPQLPPATSSPSAVAVPTRTTTPSPVVMHARQTPTPTPTPTLTIELPPPVTTVVAPPSITDYRCYPYSCRDHGSPVR